MGLEQMVTLNVRDRTVRSISDVSAGRWKSKKRMKRKKRKKRKKKQSRFILSKFQIIVEWQKLICSCLYIEEKSKLELQAYRRPVRSSARLRSYSSPAPSCNVPPVFVQRSFFPDCVA